MTIASFVTPCYGQGDMHILDLRKQAIPEGHSLGVAGGVTGGIAGETENRLYNLPLNINLRGLRFSGNQIHVELLVTNSGVTAFSMPSCVDGVKTFQFGAGDRRSMEFGIAFESPSGVQTELIEVTFGNAGSECTTLVEPKGTLLVIAEAPFPERILDTSRHDGEVPVKVFLAEVRYENARYYVKERSKKVESQTLKIRD